MASAEIGKPVLHDQIIHREIPLIIDSATSGAFHRKPNDIPHDGFAKNAGDTS